MFRSVEDGEKEQSYAFWNYMKMRFVCVVCAFLSSFLLLLNSPRLKATKFIRYVTGLIVCLFTETAQIKLICFGNWVALFEIFFACFSADRTVRFCTCECECEYESVHLPRFIGSIVRHTTWLNNTDILAFMSIQYTSALRWCALSSCLCSTLITFYVLHGDDDDVVRNSHCRCCCCCFVVVR